MESALPSVAKEHSFVTVRAWDQSAVESVAPKEHCGRNVIAMQAAAQWMEVGDVGAVMVNASASAAMASSLVAVDATTQRGAVAEGTAKETTHRAVVVTQANLAVTEATIKNLSWSTNSDNF